MAKQHVFPLFLADFAAKNCVQIGTKLMRNLRFAFPDAAEKNYFAGFFFGWNHQKILILMCVRLCNPTYGLVS